MKAQYIIEQTGAFFALVERITRNKAAGGFATRDAAEKFAKRIGLNVWSEEATK